MTRLGIETFFKNVQKVIEKHLETNGRMDI